MNSLVSSEFPLHETQSLRYDLTQTLTDSAFEETAKIHLLSQGVMYRNWRTQTF